ncbi:MAG: glycosyltransferase family 2 protein [Patescibacteria group bacterium]
MKLSLVLATFNEEKNIVDCIRSAKPICDEIIVVDGSSVDQTAKLARGEGARLIVTHNQSMFHINKQKAIDAAQGDWILLLDADERVSPELAEEIKKVVVMSEQDIEKYQENLPEKSLFERHTQLTISSRHLTKKKMLGVSCFMFNAFFIPRLNYFLGRYLRYGGVYPDGVIRLFKKGKAYLPCKDVHEQVEVKGKVGWLQNPLLHIDSPTFGRYLERNSRYIDQLTINVKQLTSNKDIIQTTATAMDWFFIKPFVWFFMTTFRHKGILDGWQGVVFSFFSALRFPRAYWRSVFTRRF